MTSPEGTTVAGRYELRDLVGRGGMADVHRAYDRLLHREVAVKLLRDTPDSATDRQRFTAEAKLLAMLGHPGLVRVLDAGTEGDRPFLVLELVEGRTLAAVLADGPPEPAWLARVGHQVAAALAHAHSHDVVHRDVKPANVLVDGAGGAKLADFGIARVVGDHLRHTRTGQTIGTAAYLAPEQVTGAAVTPAVDVYALGLVLLEALTGRRGFPGTTTESAFARLHHGPVVPLSLPAGWPRLLSAMTDLDPARRPSAEAVATSLRSLAGDAPLGATPVDGDLHPTQAVRRPAAWRATTGRRASVPLVAVGAALALVLSLGALLGGGLGGGEAAEADTRPEAKAGSATPTPGKKAAPARPSATPSASAAAAGTTTSPRQQVRRQRAAAPVRRPQAAATQKAPKAAKVKPGKGGGKKGGQGSGRGGGKGKGGGKGRR